MVCSSDHSKAVIPVLVLLFVALWFILRGDLLYVFPCVILFLCFSVLLVLRLPRLGKRELILVLFVRLFGLCLFRFVGFLFLLGSGKSCGLWLWHSLDFSLTFFANFITAYEESIKLRLPFSNLLFLKTVFFMFIIFPCPFVNHYNKQRRVLMANSTLCQSKWKPKVEPRQAKPKTHRQAPTR